MQGEALIRLQVRSREWVKRRIEVVRFIDHLTMERETTLDLELPRGLLGEFPTLQGRTLLPVKLLRRWPSLNVTVRDAEGIPLPQLNHAAERNLVAAGLAYKRYAEQADRLKRPRPDMGKLFHDILEQVGGDDSPLPMTSALPDEWEEIRNNYIEYRLIVPQVDLRSCIDKRSGGAIVRLIVSYPDRLPDPPPPSKDGDRSRLVSYIARIRKYAETVDDWPITFEVEEVEACESFQFELVAPSRIRVMDEGTLTIETEAEAEPITVLDTDPYPDRAHFLCVIPEQWTRDDAIRKSSVHLILRPMNEGSTIGLYWTAAFNAIVLLVIFLTVGWSRVPELPTFFPHIELYRPNTESIVGALLLGPTLLSGLMIRDNEHLMTRRILQKLRARVAVGGLATFIAALSFALGLPPWLLCLILGSLTAVTAPMAWAGRRSFLRSRPVGQYAGQPQASALTSRQSLDRLRSAGLTKGDGSGR